MLITEAIDEPLFGTRTCRDHAARLGAKRFNL
jgi:hypothetical protein